MEDTQSVPSKKSWKKVIIGVTLLLVLVVGLVIYSIYGYSIKLTIEETGVSFMCKSAGGETEIDSCGSACWDGYPLNRSARIKKETTPKDIFSSICPAVCQENMYCICSEGEYFGSIQEGCIDITEKKAPSKEDQDNFNKDKDIKMKKILERWKKEDDQRERQKIDL